jgi:hypothetical protein
MPDLTAMTPSAGATVPGTSARLRRAAAAERRTLARQRDDLEHRSETLRSERERIEIALIKVERQIALLDGITGADTVGAPGAASNDRVRAEPARNGSLGGTETRSLAAGSLSRVRRRRRPDLRGLALMLTRSDLFGRVCARLRRRGAESR